MKKQNYNQHTIEQLLDSIAEIAHAAQELAGASEDALMLLRDGTLPRELAKQVVQLRNLVNPDRCQEIEALAIDVMDALESLCV